MPINTPFTFGDQITLFYNLFVNFGFGSIHVAGLMFLIILAYLGMKRRWSFDTYIVIFVPAIVFLSVVSLPADLRPILVIVGTVVFGTALVRWAVK